MEFLEALKSWFFDNAARTENAYWTLMWQDGSRWKISSVNNENGNKDESWEMLKDHVVSLVRHGGVRQMKIGFRGKTNDEGKWYMLKLDEFGKYGSSGTGIAGFGGDSATGMNPWSLLIQAMNQGNQDKIAALKEQNELARKMDLLLLQQQQNQSTEERFVGVIERLLEKPNVTGLLERLVERAFPDAPGIEGGSPATDAQQPSGGDRAADGSIDFNPAIKKAMQGYEAAKYPIDWNKAVDAVLILRESGIGQPEDTLQAIAKFIAENPDAAKKMASDIMAQQQTTA